MAITVEHEKRRKKILEKALVVFMDDGFENATFQKIADKCGITRTILYLYFKNKQDIFIYSIKQLLLNLEENIKLIIADKSLRSADKIIKVLLAILKLFEQKRQFLCVVHDYLLHLSMSDIDAEARVRRRTIKFRHILSTMVIEGVKAGELKKVKAKTVHDFFYSFVEAAIFQLVVYKRNNLTELKETAAFALKQLAV